MAEDYNYSDAGILSHNGITRLYDYDEAITFCPSGWRLPTQSDWNTLIDFCGGEEVAGGNLKEKGTSFWSEPNIGATNLYKFQAHGGGSWGNL